MGKKFIEGVQSRGVGTSLKHFCLNNTERERRYSSSEVDERTLREIYLPAFERAVEAKPWTVMCSYNQITAFGRVRTAITSMTFYAVSSALTDLSSPTGTQPEIPQGR